MTDPATGIPIEPVVNIDTKQLLVTVSYSGGCEEHEFELHSTSRSDTVSIWLKHDANGDLCEAYLTEGLRLDVSERIVRANLVRMLNPNGAAVVVSRVRQATSPSP